MSSPLRGGLLARNPLLRAWLRAGGAAARLATIVRPRRGAGTGAPRRVLLCVGGHIGDAIIATAAIRDLRAALPGAEIGVACGPAGAMALAAHPALRWLHVVPHWRLDRSGASLARRVAGAARARRHAVREIARTGYDAAVDLSAHWPNMATILYRAGVPRRIGWESGGLGALYTEARPWEDDASHESARHRRLLAALLPGARWAGEPAYQLSPADPAARERAAAILRSLGMAGAPLVLHLGAGSPAKVWPAERWTGLAAALVAEGEAVLLTGQGARDGEVAARVAGAVPEARVGVDRFAWDELVEVVRGARAVVCADTAIGHVAAGAGTPCVVVFAAIDRPTRWRPAGERVAVLTHDVSCAPCFRGGGCEGMACVRRVHEDEVMAALRGVAPRLTTMEA